MKQIGVVDVYRFLGNRVLLKVFVVSVSKQEEKD